MKIPQILTLIHYMHKMKIPQILTLIPFRVLGHRHYTKKNSYNTLIL